MLVFPSSDVMTPWSTSAVGTGPSKRKCDGGIETTGVVVDSITSKATSPFVMEPEIANVPPQQASPDHVPVPVTTVPATTSVQTLLDPGISFGSAQVPFKLAGSTGARSPRHDAAADVRSATVETERSSRFIYR